MKALRVVRKFVGCCEVNAYKQCDVDTALEVVNEVIYDVSSEKILLSLSDSTLRKPRSVLSFFFSSKLAP